MGMTMTMVVLWMLVASWTACVGAYSSCQEMKRKHAEIMWKTDGMKAMWSDILPEGDLLIADFHRAGIYLPAEDPNPWENTEGAI